MAASRLGATTQEWAHWSALPIAADVLPTVCDPRIPKGKTELTHSAKIPSMVGGDGRFHGLKGWQHKQSTPGERAAWAENDALGICVVGRTLKAIDIDIEDVATVNKIHAIVDNWATAHGVRFASRRREGTPRSLLVFAVDPATPIDKCRCFFGPGKTWPVELLGNGQQFLVAGAHKSGKRYEWYGGPPSGFALLTFDQVDELWSLIAGIALEHDARGRSIRATVRTSVDYVPSPLMPAKLAGVIAELRGLLAQRSSDMPYDDWLAVLMGIQGATESAGDGFELARQWSAAGSDYCGDDELMAKWESFQRLPGEGAPAAALGTVKRLCGGAVPIAAGVFPDLTIGQPAPANAAAEAQTADERRTIDVAATEIRVVPGPEIAPQGPMIDAPGYFDRIEVPGRGQMLTPSVHSLTTAFMHGHMWPDRVAPYIFKDQFAQRTFIDGRDISDGDNIAIRRKLETNRWLPFTKITKSDMEDAILWTAERNAIDSAVNYLDALPAWDGWPRVDHFLVDVAGAADSEYARAVGRYLWLALVARIRHRGYKIDVMPVLIGASGIGKTSLVHAIAPNPEWSGNLVLDRSDKELGQQLQGRIISEIGELAGFGKRDIEFLNDFLTRTKDTFRPAYGRHHIHPKRCGILVGTTNDPEHIPHNDAVARRLAPIEVTKFERKLMDDTRDQLFAEADYLFPIYGLPYADLDRLAKPYRLAARRGTTLDSPTDFRIAEWCAGSVVGPDGRAPGRREFFTMRELCAAIGESTSNPLLHSNFKATLAALGYKQKLMRAHGVVGRFYFFEPT